MAAPVEVEGLKEFRRELRALSGDSTWTRALGQVNRSLAGEAATWAQIEATGLGGPFAHFADTITGAATATAARVQVAKVANATFWGANSAQDVDATCQAVDPVATSSRCFNTAVVLRNHMAGQSVDGPLPTIAANGTHIGLAQPIILKQNFRRDTQSIDDPAPTIMTEARLGLVEPFVIAPGSTGAPRAAQEPLPTITTGGAGAGERVGCARPMLVEPFMLSRHAEGAPRSVEEPTPTQVAKHSHCLISPYYGSGSGETCQSAEEPLPTVTSKGRFGMVVPVTHSKGGNAARDVDDPLPTMTTAKGGEFAMVMPVTHHDGSDRVRDTEEPLPTVTGANRGEIAFVEAGEHFDILFRMLEPHELAAAMGFYDEEAKYEFAGTKTEKIKQIGNAVSVAKMKACVGAIMADAAIKPVAQAQAQRRARA